MLELGAFQYGVRINLRRSESLIGQQNKILRYGRLKICATFSCERPSKTSVETG
jgi:hypothetical protein